jgi:hypothetical protein
MVIARPPDEEKTMSLRSKGSLFGIVLLAAPICVVAVAQKLERPKDFDVGDRSTYEWVMNNKAQPLEEEWTAITDQELQGTQKAGGRTFDLLLDRSPLALTKVMCHSNGRQCMFSPGIPIVMYPMEKGKKWPMSFTAKGETFTTEVTGERRVEKIEKVKVPAGEFEAYKVSFTARLKGVDSKGNAFTGKEDGAEWVAVINGKGCVVKVEYRNSFGDKFTRKLVAAEFK